MRILILIMFGIVCSLEAHAASINITSSDTYYASVVDIVPNNTSSAIATFSTRGGEFGVLNDVTSDIDTLARVTWKFEPESSFLGGVIDLSNNNFIDIHGNYSYNLYLVAGHQYWLDLFDALSPTPMKFQLSVTALSQVPLPAALFLLLPALIGFWGIRRYS